MSTPMPSPIYMLGGIFMKSGTTCDLIRDAVASAFGRSFSCAGVRSPGGVGVTGTWAIRVTAPTEIASDTASDRIRLLLMEHLRKRHGESAPSGTLPVRADRVGPYFSVSFCTRQLMSSATYRV